MRYIDTLFWDVHRELFDHDAGLFYRDHRFRAKVGDVPVSAAELLEKRKVQWGQPVSGSPYDIRREDSHEYVAGTFLLAASEMWNLVATSDHAGGGNRQ